MNRMKKHILLGGMLLCAAAFTSCNEDFKDWASPQSHAPEDAASAYSISVVAGGDAELVMDNAKDMVEILQVASVPEEMKTFNLKSVTVNGVSLPYVVEGGYVYMKAVQLDSLAEAQTLDRSNTPHQLTVASEWSGILTSGEAVPVSVETPITVTPSAKVPAIDKNGYAMLGDWQNWDNSNPTWMEEVEPGVYQAVVTTTKDGDSWFKFYNGTPFKENAAPDWGVLDANAFGSPINGDNTTPNLLVWVDDPRYEKLETPVITGADKWLVTLDMNKFCYKFESIAPETWYLIGGDIGDGAWTNTFDAIGTSIFPLAFKGDNKIVYTGYFKGDGFKLIKTPGSWDDQWGQGASFGEFLKNDGGSGNITVPEAGYYTVTLDYSANVLTVEKADIEPKDYEIGMAGSFNGWSFAGMKACTNNTHLWKVDYSDAADQEGKFLIDGWGSNWGGSDFPSGIGVQDGANIPIAAGDYVVIFNDITGGYNFIKK